MFVVGHRGAAGIAPENTLRGFRKALELGVDYVECDVHLTRDGELVVMHDETVDRTTNGSGPLAEMRLAEVRALDAGGGERVPLLGEVLALVGRRVGLMLELKGAGVEAAAVALVRDTQLLDSVTFTSFHVSRLHEVRRLEPKAMLGGILSNPSAEGLAEIKAAGASGVGVKYTQLTTAVVAQAHELGLVIRGWNPDTPDDMRRTMATGVDGVCSNRPDVLLGLLGRS